MRPPKAVSIIAAAAVSTLLVGTAANAHWSASSGRSLLVERYLVCDGDLDVRCVGPKVARTELRTALELGPILADRNNDHVVDPAHEAAVFAAYFDLQEAVEPLRAMLILPMPAGAIGTHAEFEVHGLQAEAAYALAALGDRASVAPMVELVRRLETDGHGTLWEDTLAALTRLSPPAASAYAREFLGRMELADTRMSMPGGSSQLHVLTPIVLAQDREALEVLRKLTDVEDATTGGAPRVPLADSHTWCRLMGTRLRLGDPRLVDKVRTAFAGSYSGTMVATCDNEFLGAYGNDPKDVGILLRHLGREDLGFDAGMSLTAYGRVIALVAHLRDRQDPAAKRARRQLLEGLRARSEYPHVRDETHVNFGRHFVVLHHAALAGLGEQGSLDVLRQRMLDAADTSGIGDLAALRALQLGLPGAIDDASARLALDVAFVNDERSGIFEDLRGRLLDALVAAAPDDPRWTVALVDAEADVREQAIAIVARHTPQGTCDAVIGGAAEATTRGIDDGFLVLTTVGAGCREQFDRLAHDARSPAKIRGMAFEALAVLGSGVARGVREAAMKQPGLEIHLDRAAAIRAALASR